MSNEKKKITQNEGNKGRKKLSRFLHVSRTLCLILIVLAISGCSEPKNTSSDTTAADTSLTASGTGITAANTGGDASNTGLTTAGTDSDTSNTGLTAAGTDSDTSADTSSSTEDAQVIEEGGSLVIAVSELSETAQFYPVEVDGTRMEVIAVKDSDGNIRTAFNTCQICYSSGRGYYVQDGNVLVCQNCGNRFTVDQIEIESGGCNPWPIFEENKTVTEDSIEISYDFLNESKNIFANWKSSY